MPQRIKPKKYLLSKKKRDELTKYMNGGQGERTTARAMGVTQQSLRCIVVSTLRHANMTKKISFEEIIKKY